MRNTSVSGGERIQGAVVIFRARLPRAAPSGGVKAAIGVVAGTEYSAGATIQM